MHNIFASDLRRRARERDYGLRLPVTAALMPCSDPEMSYRLSEVQKAFDRLSAGQKQLVVQLGLQRRGYAVAAADRHTRGNRPTSNSPGSRAAAWMK